MSLYEVVSLVVSILSALFVGITILLLARQIKVAHLAHAENHDWNRRIETQHVINKIRELNTDELNRRFEYMDIKEPIPLKEIKKAFEEDQSLQVLLHRVLNFYEGLANGIYLGTYDEKVIRANRKNTIEREFNRFRKYINYRREDGNRPTAWAGIERLIDDWTMENVHRNDMNPIGK